MASFPRLYRWMVLWALLPTHNSQSVFTEPERFDPDRFSPERAEDQRHEHAFVPQGAGPALGHRCPEQDFATYFMAVFTVVLLRGYDWSLPPQSFDCDWTKTPPARVRSGILRISAREGVLRLREHIHSKLPNSSRILWRCTNLHRQLQYSRRESRSS